MSDYHINIFYSEEDGRLYLPIYLTWSPVPLLAILRQVALAEVERAKPPGLAAARDSGRPILSAPLSPSDLSNCPLRKREYEA